MVMEKILILKAKTGEKCQVPKKNLECCKFISNMLEEVDVSDGMEIPISEVEGPILVKVID